MDKLARLESKWTEEETGLRSKYRTQLDALSTALSDRPRLVSEYHQLRRGLIPSLEQAIARTDSLLHELPRDPSFQRALDIYQQRKELADQLGVQRHTEQTTVLKARFEQALESSDFERAHDILDCMADDAINAALKERLVAKIKASL
jgi:hypothetical protein